MTVSVSNKSACFTLQDENKILVKQTDKQKTFLFGHLLKVKYGISFESVKIFLWIQFLADIIMDLSEEAEGHLMTYWKFLAMTCFIIFYICANTYFSDGTESSFWFLCFLKLGCLFFWLFFKLSYISIRKFYLWFHTAYFTFKK